LAGSGAGTSLRPMLVATSQPKFTERQRQVIRLIARGYSNPEVAEILGVSPRTVKAHSDVLRMKLRVPRRRQIPSAFRELTGEDPHDPQSLEPALGARDESRVP
jgi:DNA-binding NarL/FixJ family response regulator